MANPEHVEIVKQGKEAIDAWRDENPYNCLDLSEANLSGADLSGAELSEAKLSEAKLSEAKLSEAKLSEAKLSGAVLRGAKLSGGDLSGADLSQASCWFTVFSDVDLSSANGLETIRHQGPSTIGIDTLHRSGGKIPEVFLRECGLAPWEVLHAKLYDQSLTAAQISDIQYKVFEKRAHGPLFLGGVFISYSHADSNFVDKLYKRLQGAGASVWLDRHDMAAGSLQKQISRAIRLNDVVLLVLSEASVQSDWVENELDMARKKEKEEGREVLCPVALDDSWKSKAFDNDSEERALWRTLARKNILDFSKWKTKAFEEPFEKLLRGLKVNYPKQDV